MPIIRCQTPTVYKKGFSYIKNGKKINVKPTCIKDTSLSHYETIEIRKKINKLLKKRNMIKTSKLNCPPGMIERIAYIKHKRHSRKTMPIRAVCMEDRGAIGKGKLIVASMGLRYEKEGEHFHKYGYTDVNNKTPEIRHRILRKIYKRGFDSKWLPLYRKLILLSTLNKNTNKSLSKSYKRDAHWLKKRYSGK